MKTILCYGDSNTWGAVPLVDRQIVSRFSLEERWAGVLRSELGSGYWVIEEGLNGRTTVRDDPVEGLYKNGLSYLQPCLETHASIDWVVLMLGTNDLKQRFGVSPYEVSQGISTLLAAIAASGSGPGWQAPKTLLLAPPPFGRMGLFADLFEGGAEKSHYLGDHYRAVAQQHGCAFLNTAEIIVSSDVDGIHLDAPQHIKLGRHVARIIQELAV